MEKRKIAVGCDHGGLEHKEAVKAHLLERGFDVKDLGIYENKSVDYPEIAAPLAEAVAAGACELGLSLIHIYPARVLGIYKEPLLAPEAPYEADEGFRQQVIFPGGMILEPDGEVKIYYGAADTVECLATAHVDDLVRLCLEGK